MIEKGSAQAPPRGETSAHPEVDKIVVFHDFFAAGLRFQMDRILVKILELYNMHVHQLTPNSFVQLNLYFWLAKTCRFEPSVEA